MIDFTFTDAQKELQQKARKFALEEILPVVHYFDEVDIFPTYIFKKAWEAGLLNLSIPKKYGGNGYGLIEEAIVVEEIAACGPGLATSLFGNTLGQEPLMLCNNEAAKDKYLPIFLKEPKVISFATSEPMMGSDVAGMRCLAKEDEATGDYILNGSKYWITNAGVADYYSVFATNDPKARHKGICCFLIEKGWEGITIGKHIPKTGQRCSNTVLLKFDNCRVPKENVLAAPGGEGFKLGMKTFGKTRPIIGAFAVGAARSAMEFAIEYANRRRAFGQTIANFEGVSFKIAEMFQKVETSRLMTLKAAWEADQGMDPTIQASMTKFYATECANEVVAMAIQIFGGAGFTKLMPLEKLMRDVRVLTIYEGTSEVQRIVVSRYALAGYKPVMPKIEAIPRWEPEEGADPKEVAKNGITPKTQYRCKICGHIHTGEEPPEECPVCGMPKGAFNKVA